MSDGLAYKLAIVEIDASLYLNEGEDSANLGSTEEFFQGFGIECDEYTIDEVNYKLVKRGLHIIDEHGQLILEKY